MLRFKLDILQRFRERGYTANRLRKEKLFGGATIGKMRHRNIVSMNELHRVCELLDEQPGELIEYVKEDSGEAHEE